MRLPKQTTLRPHIYFSRELKEWLVYRPYDITSEKEALLYQFAVHLDRVTGRGVFAK